MTNENIKNNNEKMYNIFDDSVDTNINNNLIISNTSKSNSNPGNIPITNKNMSQNRNMNLNQNMGMNPYMGMNPNITMNQNMNMNQNMQIGGFNPNTPMNPSLFPNQNMKSNFVIPFFPPPFLFQNQVQSQP